MRRLGRLTILALGIVGLALLLAACSGSGGSGSTDSGGGGTSPAATTTATYTNDQYGFTLSPDAQFTKGEPVAGASSGGSPVFSIVFADKKGTIISDRYVDAVQVSVYELSREIKPSEVPQLKTEIQGVVDELMKSAAPAKVVQPLEEVTVNGVPGFGFKYTYTEGGKELTAVTFFLIKGKYEYQITAQTTSANWEALKGKLEAAVQTLTIK